jgi:hypothetical protein
MLLEFIAMAAAAIGAAGIAHLLRRVSRGWLPKWLVPASAGAAMLAFAIWSEYSWFGRATSDLPEGVAIVSTTEVGVPWRPWSYAYPVTEGFVALDRRQMAQHPVRDDLRLAPLYNFGRWRPTVNGMVAVDCTSLRRVMLTTGVEINAEGVLTGADWLDAGPDDLILIAACKEV